MTNPFLRNGGAKLPQVRREEFKEVKCEGCGCAWRKVVSGYCRLLQHRLELGQTGHEAWEWHICVGCGKQLNIKSGAAIAPDQEGAIPPEIMKAIAS